MSTPRRLKVSILKEIALPDGQAILLYEPPAATGNLLAEDYNNVVRIDSDGGIIWRVGAPSPAKPSDAFVEIEAGQCLIARRFFGDRFDIDIETGRATHLGWSK